MRLEPKASRILAESGWAKRPTTLGSSSTSARGHRRLLRRIVTDQTQSLSMTMNNESRAFFLACNAGDKQTMDREGINRGYIFPHL